MHDSYVRKWYMYNANANILTTVIAYHYLMITFLELRSSLVSQLHDSYLRMYILSCGTAIQPDTGIHLDHMI